MLRRILGILHGSEREMDTVTVSYKRLNDNVVTSRVGYGTCYGQALADADMQLQDGTYKRIAISYPGSIRTDVDASRTARFARYTKYHGEGSTIIVQRNLVTVIEF